MLILSGGDLGFRGCTRVQEELHGALLLFSGSGSGCVWGSGSFFVKASELPFQFLV